jgi:DNA-binding transcriptional LysR family regulator
MAQRLVVRAYDGIELTEAGERLLPIAEELERTVLAAALLAEGQAERVRLAVPSGLSSLFAAEIPAFHRRHAGVTIEVLSGSKPLDLVAGEADLAVRMGVVKDERLIARVVGISGWSLYASRGYLARHPQPINPRSLAGHDVLGFDEALSGTPGARWIAEHAEGATIVLRTREMTEMLAVAVNGGGLAVLPCNLGDRERALVRVTPEVLGTHPISVVYAREAMNSAAVRAVKRLAIRVLKLHAAALSGEPG